MRSMTVFNYLLEATLAGSVLILLVVGVRGLLRHRLGSRSIYVAWGIVAARLLLPIALPNPLMDEFRPGLSVDVAARPVADQVRRRLIDAGSTVSSHMAGSGGKSVAYLVQSTRGGQAGKWFLLGWLIVAVLVTAWLLLRQHRLTVSVRRNRVRPLDDEEQAAYRALCDRYHIRRPIPVFYADRLSTGCLVGVAHPLIALPLDMPAEHLPMQLAHQLCHLRALDPVWGVVRALCCSIHWFNPLVWMAAWLSYHDGEMACDDRVTARLHDLDRLAYANVIVSAGERENATASLSAGASFTNQHIRQRVTSVIRCVRGSRTGVALGSLAAAAVLLFSFATRESEPLPTIDAVPVMAWTAAAEPVGDDMAAIAAARRFLESPFIGEDTSIYAFTARSDPEGWLVQARQNHGTEEIVLRFSAEGELLHYDGLCLVDGEPFTDSTYTHRRLTQSLQRYMDAFITDLLPGLAYDGSAAMADIRRHEDRLLVGELTLGKAPVCQFTLQVEPIPRMLMVQMDGAVKKHPAE